MKEKIFLKLETKKDVLKEIKADKSLEAAFNALSEHNKKNKDKICFIRVADDKDAKRLNLANTLLEGDFNDFVSSENLNIVEASEKNATHIIDTKTGSISKVEKADEKTKEEVSNWDTVKDHFYKNAFWYLFLIVVIIAAIVGYYYFKKRKETEENEEDIEEAL